MEEAYPIFNEISAILGNTSSRYLVIQVGSSSGREIAYFAKMFPQHDFVGTDIYDEIVEYASQCTTIIQTRHLLNAQQKK